MLKRTQVQLTEEQIRALRLLSASTGQSTSELVRQSVDRMLAVQPPRSYEERLAQANRLVGAYSSEETDIAINHDKYLAEDFA
ncbi:MAG: hypothetical protein OHK0021_23770 [Bryobacter sp.]